MDWTNWQGNIESIFSYFLGFSQPLLRFGKLTRDSLISYCKANYIKLDESYKFNLEWNYSNTWNNTYLPAMFKLGLLKQIDGYIWFTEAGKQLATFEINGSDFFKRQLIEYQYVNPYQDSSIKSLSDCNLFPYWFLLKLLNELDYLTYNEAVYIILKIPRYDSEIYKNTINSIRKLREIEKSTSAEKLDEKLKDTFGEKVSLAKAWQYERNFLKWTGFCIEQSNKVIAIDKSKKYELSLLLKNEPKFINYIDKTHYSEYFGRPFNTKPNYHYISEDDLHIIESKDTNEVILTVKDSQQYNTKDIILLGEKDNNFSVTYLGVISKISYKENDCSINITKIEKFDLPISKDIIDSIIGGKNETN